MILTKKGVLIQILYVLVYDTLIAAVYAMNDESDIDGSINFNAAIVGNQSVFKFTCESFQRPIGDAISFQVNLSTVDVVRHNKNTCYDRYQECRTDTCSCYYDGVKFIMEYWYQVLNSSESFIFGVELILKDKQANIVVVTLSRFYNGKDFGKLEIVKETNQYKFMENTEKFVNDSEMGASKEWIMKVLTPSVGLILMVIFSVLFLHQYCRLAREVVNRCSLFKFSYISDESEELKPYISNTTTTDCYIPNGVANEKNDSETDLLAADNVPAKAFRSSSIENFESVPDIIEGLETSSTFMRRNEEFVSNELEHEDRKSVIDLLDCDVKPAKDEPFVFFSQENKSQSVNRKLQSSDKRMQYSYKEIDIDQSIDVKKNSLLGLSNANQSCGNSMQCNKTKEEIKQCIDVRGTDSEGQIYISSTIKPPSVLCRHYQDETIHSSVPVRENEDVCQSTLLDVFEGLEKITSKMGTTEQCISNKLDREPVVNLLDADNDNTDKPFMLSQENKSFGRRIQSFGNRMQAFGKRMQKTDKDIDNVQSIDAERTDSEEKIDIYSRFTTSSLVCEYPADQSIPLSVFVPTTTDVCKSRTDIQTNCICPFGQLIDEDYKTDEVSSDFDETESSQCFEFSAENNNTRGDIWELRAGQLNNKDYETAELSSEFEETETDHLFEFSAKNNNAEGDIWEVGSESGQLFDLSTKNKNTDGDIWEFGAECGPLLDVYPEYNDTEGDTWKLGDSIPYEDFESDEDSSDFEDTDIELSTATVSTCVSDGPSSNDDESIGMHLCSSCMLTFEKILRESSHEDKDSVIDIFFFYDESAKDQSDIVVQPYKSLSKRLQYNKNTEEADQFADARKAHLNWQIKVETSPVFREETEYTPSITKNKEKASLVIRETETWKSRSTKALENLGLRGSYSKDCQSKITCKNAVERQLVSKTSLKAVTGVPNNNCFVNANSTLRCMQAQNITLLYIPFKDFDRRTELLIHSTICRSFKFHNCSCVNRQDPKLGDDDLRHVRLGLKHRKSKLCSNMHMDDPHIDDFDAV